MNFEPCVGSTCQKRAHCLCCCKYVNGSNGPKVLKKRAGMTVDMQAATVEQYVVVFFCFFAFVFQNTMSRSKQPFLKVKKKKFS